MPTKSNDDVSESELYKQVETWRRRGDAAADDKTRNISGAVERNCDDNGGFSGTLRK
jgi:hypothetical protein